MAGLDSIIKISGDKEIERALKGLATGSVKRVMRPALNAGLVIVNKAAKTLVHKDSGALKSSIGKKVTVAKKGGLNGRVYIRGGYTNAKGVEAAEYAAAVEFGTDRTPAYPFLRPALYDNRVRVNAAIAAVARVKLAGEVSRLAGKG